jgi:hypothetical protein
MNEIWGYLFEWERASRDESGRIALCFGSSCRCRVGGSRVASHRPRRPGQPTQMAKAVCVPNWVKAAVQEVGELLVSADGTPALFEG